MAFLGPVPSGMEVDHVDGDKGNNRPGNLEYVTHQENIIRAGRMGKMSRPGINRGEKAANSKLKTADVLRLVELHRSGVSHSQLSERFGVSRSVSEMICLGRRWQHVTGIEYRPIGRGSRSPLPATPANENGRAP